MKNHTLHTEFSVSEIFVTYKRSRSKTTQKISSSRDVYNVSLPYYNDHIDHYECFRVLLLDRAHNVIGIHKVSQGGASGTVVDQKIILQAAILANASAIVLTHNHPSGTLRPSEQDKRLTKKFQETCKTHDLPILDHLIITVDGYFSFADEGLL